MYFFFIIFGFLSLVACTGQKENSEKPDGLLEKVDFLQTFLALQQKETSLIDFRREAGPEPYLLHGWETPEKSYTWTTGLLLDDFKSRQVVLKKNNDKYG